MFEFTPDNTPKAPAAIPWFEDTDAKTAPGYYTEKDVKQLQQEIVATLKRMNAFDVTFESGVFGVKPKRYGYLITFRIANTVNRWIDCREHVAGFPMYRESAELKDRVLRQALFAYRDYLKAELSAGYFRPAYNPFTTQIVMENGRTLTEAVAERYALLPSANGNGSGS